MRGIRVAVARTGATTTKRRAAFALLLVAIVGFGAVAGVLASERAEASELDQARSSAMDAAKTRVAGLLSYDYRTLEKNLADAKASTTGPFSDDFRSLTTQVIGPTARDREVVTHASVAGASVVSATDDEVGLLLFVNQQTQGKGVNGQQVGTSRVRASMHNIDGQWLISDLKPM